jgi:ankyrin repeat protein
MRAAIVLAIVWGALVLQPAPAVGADVPLIAAVKRADAGAVKGLLQQHADVNVAEADGTTALHWAVRLDEAEIADLLLGAGAHLHAVNRYGVTPLQLAAVNGSASMIRKLLDAGADPNAVLPEGETVLMTAARTGRPDALRLLLDRGADVHGRERWFGETALIWAAVENHADAVRLLIDRGAEVDGRSATLSFERRRSGQSILPLGSWTPLMYAARENALDAGRALVDAGAALDLVDPDGATALVIAIINAHYEFAALLLESGADPNVVDHEAGMGPLYAAVDMHRLAVGHGRPNPKPAGLLDAVDIVRMLLDRKADPNARLKAPTFQRHHTFGDASLGAGATPFMRAAKSGDVEVMTLLLAAGADPALTMPNGSTALMYAAGLGWRDGSPAAPSFDQGTPEEAIEAIQLLLASGFDINAVNDNGDTALHVAVTGRGEEPIVRFLIESGADLRALNKRGQTPLAAAEASRRERDHLAALLREAMAAR